MNNLLRRSARLTCSLSERTFSDLKCPGGSIICLEVQDPGPSRNVDLSPKDCTMILKQDLLIPLAPSFDVEQKFRGFLQPFIYLSRLQ